MTWHVSNRFSRQEKGSKRNESTDIWDHQYHWKSQLTVQIATSCFFLTWNFFKLPGLSTNTNKTQFSLHHCLAFSRRKIATLWNKRKLAVVAGEDQDEHPRNSQTGNTSGPRVNEDYINQASEEIESTVTKKLSQEFSKKENPILGAMSKLVEFLLNPQVRGTIRNRSGNIKEHRRWKPEIDQVSLPEWSSSSSRVVRLSVPSGSPLRHRRGSLQAVIFQQLHFTCIPQFSYKGSATSEILRNLSIFSTTVSKHLSTLSWEKYRSKNLRTHSFDQLLHVRSKMLAKSFINTSSP